MKKLTIFYWITTGLVLFFFVPGAIMNVMKTPDWVEVFQQLGYPEYLLPFLGVAKLLGCLVVVLPQFRRLKEWAYAGLVIDLVGAIYSAIMVSGFDPRILFVVFAAGIVLLNYWLWHRRLEFAQAEV